MLYTSRSQTGVSEVQRRVSEDSENLPFLVQLVDLVDLLT